MNKGAITERTVNFFERVQKDKKEAIEYLREYEKTMWEELGKKYTNEKYKMEATGEELFNIVNYMQRITAERDIRADKNLEKLFEMLEKFVNSNQLIHTVVQKAKYAYKKLERGVNGKRYHTN